jgi:ubiquinone/menaquinone biosynthesis C-methylase UbiE
MEDFWARYLKPSGQLGSHYWNYCAERMVQLVDIPAAASILDIGTCDGNVLFKAMKKVESQGYGIGIDIYSGDFIAGFTQAKSLGWKENIALIQMDANTLGFPTETFHTVTANFVGWDDCFDFDRLEIITPDRKLAEIRRVLKPGGQVGIGFWIEQDDINWISEEFKKYLPESAEIIGEKITAYGRENPVGYETILRSGGFYNIFVQVETDTFVSSNKEDWWWQLQITASDYFNALPELNELKEQILIDLRHYQSDKGIYFNKTVGYAFGTKP